MSNLQITGTITKITDVQEGTAKSSGKTWKKLGFVVQTTSEYPKDVFFSVFGEEKVENFLNVLFMRLVDDFFIVIWVTVIF